MYQVAKSERELYCLFVNFFIDDKGAVRNKSERNSLKDKTTALFSRVANFFFFFFFFFFFLEGVYRSFEAQEDGIFHHP